MPMFFWVEDMSNTISPINTVSRNLINAVISIAVNMLMSSGA